MNVINLIRGFAYHSNKTPNGYYDIWDFRAVGAKIIHTHSKPGYTLCSKAGEQTYGEITQAMQALCEIYGCPTKGSALYILLNSPDKNHNHTPTKAQRRESLESLAKNLREPHRKSLPKIPEDQVLKDMGIAIFRDKTVERGVAISQKEWDKLTIDNQIRDPFNGIKGYI